MTGRPYVVAHRGVSSSFPENTLVAIQAAIDLGVDWIEIDVVTTADGVVILSHDSAADRCTSGTGLFKTMMLEQVKTLDAGSWFDARFSGERIPTLDEVITFIEHTPVRLCIEIKGDTEADFRETAERVVALLQRRDFLRPAVITSFDAGCLRRVREIEPLLAVHLDPTPQDGSLTPWELCQQCLKCGANFMSHTYRTLTADIVAEAHAHGLDVWVWTVNEAATMKSMIALEVDAIFSDDPATLQAVLARSSL